MSAGRAAAGLRPYFADGLSGRLFCLLHEPRATVPAVAPVLCCPGFAEEMNKTRRSIALQARALADHGRAVLVPDLHGTGESSGDFADARWETWVADLAQLRQALAREYSMPPVLWGVRTGALLAAEVLQGAQDAAADLVLWQPVLSGQQFLTQFLRLRMAAELSGGGGQGADTRALRADLKAGKSVEVAGYEIAGALGVSLDSKTLTAGSLERARRIGWFEVSSSEQPSLSPIAHKLIEGCRASGITVHAEAVSGPPFWSTPETTVAPALIDATTAYLTRSAA